MDNHNSNIPADENERTASEANKVNAGDSANSASQKLFDEDGSYEIVFGADRMKEDTRYSAGGYNAYGFNANGSSTYRPAGSTSSEPSGSSAPPSRKNQKKKRRSSSKTQTASTVMLVLASVLFLFSIVLSVTALVTLNRQDPAYTFSPLPENTAPVDPWINPATIPSDDAYANATAKTVNSVVVISASSPSSSSSGSGLIWASNSSFSYILTCNHVIEGQSEIQVTLNNSESYFAELVGVDARTDIALLKIDATGLSPIILPNEDSKLVLGQAVIAIGNPLGVLGNSVTNGILSSLARTITVEGTTMEVIQTNAAVNSGNSGGGLFDMNGQLIGMVNAKVGQTAVEGIGFAIPYTTLKTICEELIAQGYVSGRPQIGITTVTVDSTASADAAIRQYPDLESYIIQKSFFQSYYTAGVYVVNASGVVAYSEGSDKFEFGDRITAIGGDTISNDADITSALNNYSAGDTVQITVTRKNKPVIIELILGEVGK